MSAATTLDLVPTNDLARVRAGRSSVRSHGASLLRPGVLHRQKTGTDARPWQVYAPAPDETKGSLAHEIDNTIGIYSGGGRHGA
jgi:hypothetical protein